MTAPPTSPPVAPPRLEAPALHRAAGPRLIGPDVVRAVALIGVVVMNYHGYLINQGGELADNFWGRVFHPWRGPLSTRFAATFVLTAGVGVTLLTQRAVAARDTDPAGVTSKWWTLLRRGLLLYGFGLIVYEIWSGSILPYYGAMFIVAAAIFTLATPWLVVIGVAAAVAGASVEWWRWERAADGYNTDWLTNPPGGSPRGLVFDMYVNGTHPLLPWLAFLCAGIVVGRLLRTHWWRPATLAVGLTLFGLATLLSDALGGGDAGPLALRLASRHPFDRGLLYVASALGTALVAFTVVSTLAERFVGTPVVGSIVRLFADAGQMSLTLYLLHVLVFNFVVRWHGWIEPSGLDLALTFAAGFWVVAIAAGAVWHRRFGIGPVEWLYRKLGN